MKHLLLALACLASLLSHARGLSEPEWRCLVEAIAAVESSKNPKAVNGRHAGYLQISPCVVQDCNIYLKQRKYTNADRFSVGKSVEMFRLIQRRYNPEGALEKAIRLWNGGPRYRVKSTDGYYRRVLKRYREELGRAGLAGDSVGE